MVFRNDRPLHELGFIMLVSLYSYTNFCFFKATADFWKIRRKLRKTEIPKRKITSSWILSSIFKVWPIVSASSHTIVDDRIVKCTEIAFYNNHWNEHYFIYKIKNCQLLINFRLFSTIKFCNFYHGTRWIVWNSRDRRL